MQNTNSRSSGGDGDMTTSITMPRRLRFRLEVIRLARADRGVPPRLREIVLEALTQFIEREAAR